MRRPQKNPEDPLATSTAPAPPDRWAKEMSSGSLNQSKVWLGRWMDDDTARSIIIGELQFFFAQRGLNGCLGRLSHACRVLLGQGNHLHNPDLVGTKGIMVL